VTHLKTNKTLFISLLIIIVAALVLMMNVPPNKKSRVLAEAEEYISRGDIDGGLKALDKLADVSKETYELTGVWLMKMCLSLSAVVQDFTLTQQYQNILEELPPYTDAADSYEVKADFYQTRSEERVKALDELADSYRRYYHQEGLRINTPFNEKAFVDLSLSSEKISEALGHLLAGDDGEKYYNQLEQFVGMEAVGGVYWLIVEQDEQNGRDEVSISGRIKLPELLLAISGHVSKKDLAQWFLQRVLDETNNQPDHPARIEAKLRLAAI
jgi:gamma-glutamylcyclotransferase (GGCT)/AIG2-like uncharacterized protein YtfP